MFQSKVLAAAASPRVLSGSFLCLHGLQADAWEPSFLPSSKNISVSPGVSPYDVNQPITSISGESHFLVGGLHYRIGGGNTI